MLSWQALRLYKHEKGTGTLTRCSPITPYQVRSCWHMLLAQKHTHTSINFYKKNTFVRSGWLQSASKSKMPLSKSYGLVKIKIKEPLLLLETDKQNSYCLGNPIRFFFQWIQKKLYPHHKVSNHCYSNLKVWIHTKKWDMLSFGYDKDKCWRCRFSVNTHAQHV